MADDIETITVVRPPTKAKFGDPGTGPPTTFTIDGCQFAPGPSVELGDASTRVQSDGTVYAPPDIPTVLPTDRVIVRGDEYAVVGQPAEWGSEGVVIVLRRITG